MLEIPADFHGAPRQITTAERSRHARRTFDSPLRVIDGEGGELVKAEGGVPVVDGRHGVDELRSIVPDQKFEDSYVQKPVRSRHDLRHAIGHKVATRDL